eukprot:m.451830 g.451830  ORF g.451830 m.451830 type:complete len:327 (+) comp20218_c0_seq1:151-1131(+)
MDQRIEAAASELTSLAVLVAEVQARITRAASRSRVAAVVTAGPLPQAAPLQVWRLESTAAWCDQVKEWPKEGHVIMAHYDESSIVVYAAFNKEIASWAVEHQRFGGPQFSTERLTWIKPNFLWMMYRCGWALKDKNQAHVLAITMSRDAFEEVLWQTWPTSYRESGGPIATRDEWKAAKPQKGHGVQMQWDPDHSPAGGKLERRAIQLGLSPHVQATIFNTPHGIRRIDDITDYVAAQRERLVAGGGGAGVGEKRKGPVPAAKEEAKWQSDGDFMLPTERPYVVKSEALARLICVTGASWPGGAETCPFTPRVRRGHADAGAAASE